VADVPDDLVRRRIEHPVERQRQLDHAEVGRQVAGIAGHGLNDDVTDLGRELIELGTREFSQVGGAVNALEEAHPKNRSQVSAVATPSRAPTKTSSGVWPSSSIRRCVPV